MENRWNRQKEEEQADKETEPDSHAAIKSREQTEQESENAHKNRKWRKARQVKTKQNRSKNKPKGETINTLQILNSNGAR